ncbi:MAG TPA: hypothetical protein VFL57_11540 [Bryobacteraceae bacterium]|nr:hypothetical protein [Bryobacteraceae bacterium]
MTEAREASAIHMPHPGASTGPVREVVIQIGDFVGERIEVQVRERAGAVRVHVRATDAEVTTALRARLGELVRSITDKGLRIEAWTPAETWPSPSAAAPVEAPAGPRETAFPGDHGNWTGAGHHNSEHERNTGWNTGSDKDTDPDHRRGRARELWLEEMERRLGWK